MSMPVTQSLSPDAFDFSDCSSDYLNSTFDTKSCDCLQQLAALFVQLKVSAQESDNVFQAAVAMSHVREGVHVWKRHLQCKTCMDMADADSLHLSIIEIRMAVHVIQRISNNLSADSQAIFSVQAITASQRQVAYTLAQEESQAIIRTLLLQSTGSVIAILDRTAERASLLGKSGAFPTWIYSPSPQLSPSSLLSSHTGDHLASYESNEEPHPHIAQSLQDLKQWAKEIEKYITAGPGSDGETLIIRSENCCNTIA